MPRVLLVADADWVVNEVKGALALGDWKIEVTSEPGQVTELITDRQPDAVIVDMQVGTMGGMAVVRAIRQQTHESNRPRTVILLDRSADEFIARRAGADAGVLKPIRSSALRDALSPPPAIAASAEEE